MAFKFKIIQSSKSRTEHSRIIQSQIWDSLEQKNGAVANVINIIFVRISDSWNTDKI